MQVNENINDDIILNYLSNSINPDSNTVDNKEKKKENTKKDDSIIEIIEEKNKIISQMMKLTEEQDKIIQKLREELKDYKERNSLQNEFENKIKLAEDCQNWEIVKYYEEEINKHKEKYEEEAKVFDINIMKLYERMNYYYQSIRNNSFSPVKRNNKKENKSSLSIKPMTNTKIIVSERQSSPFKERDLTIDVFDMTKNQNILNLIKQLKSELIITKEENAKLCKAERLSEVYKKIYPVYEKKYLLNEKNFNNEIKEKKKTISILKIENVNLKNEIFDLKSKIEKIKSDFPYFSTEASNEYINDMRFKSINKKNRINNYIDNPGSILNFNGKIISNANNLEEIQSVNQNNNQNIGNNPLKVNQNKVKNEGYSNTSQFPNANQGNNQNNEKGHFNKEINNLNKEINLNNKDKFKEKENENIKENQVGSIVKDGIKLEKAILNRNQVGQIQQHQYNQANINNIHNSNIVKETKETNNIIQKEILIESEKKEKKRKNSSANKSKANNQSSMNAYNINMNMGNEEDNYDTLLLIITKYYKIVNTSELIIKNKSYSIQSLFFEFMKNLEKDFKLKTKGNIFLNEALGMINQINKQFIYFKGKSIMIYHFCYFLISKFIDFNERIMSICKICKDKDVSMKIEEVMFSLKSSMKEKYKIELSKDMISLFN